MIKKKTKKYEVVVCDYCKEEMTKDDIVAHYNGDYHHSCLVKKLEEEKKDA